MLNRRSLVLSALVPAIRLRAAPGSMQLCMHQTTSTAAGYRKSLQGYARAGIKYVEVIFPHLEPFVKTEGMPAARRYIRPWSDRRIGWRSTGTLGAPTPTRARAVEEMKRLVRDGRRTRCRPHGLPVRERSEKYSDDDYKRGVDNMHEAGEIARQIPIIPMVEFMRGSTFIGTLPTSLRLTREAAHSNIRPMFDCYHFWAGLSKFEDLELVNPGEISHVHFQDVPGDLANCLTPPA